MANVVIGTLEIDGPGEVFLLISKILETVNHSTICELFEKCMFPLWPEGIRYDDVLLFVTDAASYIVKAGKAVQAFYPKMVHITCLAHGLHRVAEEIMAHFSLVDSLVSETKKIFVQVSLTQTALQVHGSRCPTPTRTCHHEMGHVDICGNILLRPFPDCEKCYRNTES